ncbi:MAG: hypothetical protein V2B18_08500, partial [Pseudomonadota bacterium]
AFGVRSVIGYGGLVTRAENQAMIHRLRITMKRLTRLNPSNYYGIALVDAQPGTGNNLITPRHDPPLIVIDHHPARKMSFKSPFHDIRPLYGATSTIVSEYIAAAGLTPTKQVANALLYGIKTDTHSLLRGASKPDFCAFNFLSPYTNPRVIGWIENPCLPQTYFADYHRGLSNTKLYRDVAVSYLHEVSAEAIIPELADVLLRISGICWSLCIGRYGSSLVLSLRSSSRKLMAGTVLLKLVGKAGSAGGHKEMAGGQIRVENASDAEADAIVAGLIKDFLGLIGRPGVNGKPLVAECEQPA